MLTNFVSVLGILLVAAFVVMGIYFLIERIGEYFTEKRQEKIYQSQLNYIPYNHVRPGSIPSSSFCVRCSREATLYDLNRRLTELEQFYAIDSDDESLVDMVKRLRDDVDNLTVKDDAIDSDDELYIDMLTDMVKEVRDDIDKINNKIGELEYPEKTIEEKLSSFIKLTNEKILNITEMAKKSVDNSEYAKATLSSYREYFLDFSTRLENLETKGDSDAAKLDA